MEPRHVRQPPWRHRALLAQGNRSTLLAVHGGGHVLNAARSGQVEWEELSIETPVAYAAALDFLRVELQP